MSGAQPVAVSAARLAIAAAILLAVALVKRTSDRAPTSHENMVFAFAGIALAVHFVTWIWSLQYISVAVSTLLVATTPIWTALYDARFKHRSFTRLTLAGFILGAAGLVCVVSTVRTSAPIAGHIFLGALLAFSGSLAIGAYFLMVREVRDAFGTRTIVTRTYAWAAAVLIIASILLRQAPPAIDDGAAWAGIIGMALISQLVGHTALNAALRWFSPSAVAFATLLEPVFAGVLAWAIFH
ncbi:MAG: DMT family transporter, partial [Candidatus Eremiobacteraeota bacterium]|nr:DMT family transporter [Candidatus Eremiobacteraeota bacterium]